MDEKTVQPLFQGEALDYWHYQSLTEYLPHQPFSMREDGPFVLLKVSSKQKHLFGHHPAIATCARFAL